MFRLTQLHVLVSTGILHGVPSTVEEEMGTSDETFISQCTTEALMKFNPGEVCHHGPHMTIVG